MKKLMFVIPSLHNGGAERVVSRLSGGLVHRGYEVHILELYRPEQGYDLDPAVHLHSLCPSKAVYQRIASSQKNRMIRSAVFEADPDVIVPFLDYTCQKLQMLTLFTKYFRRIIVTVRNSPSSGTAKEKLLRFLSIMIARACIVQSDRQKQYYPAFLHRKIFSIANPVEQIDEGYTEPDRPFRFIAAGRLTRQKNYPLLLTAFAKAARSRNVTLDIFGAGNEAAALNAMIDRLGLQQKAFLRGYSKDIVAEYRRSTAYVLSSDWEGMPNALLEAMHLGLPCIATDCPTGPAELIQNEVTGLLVPMNDANALASAMIRMIDDPDLRRRTGAAARKFIIKEHNLAHILTLWEEALGKSVLNA